MTTSINGSLGSIKGLASPVDALGVANPLVTLWFANLVTVEEFVNDVFGKLADTSELVMGVVEIVADVSLRIVDTVQTPVDCGKEGARVMGGAPQLGFGAGNSDIEFGLAEVPGDIADQVIEARGVLPVSVANVMVIWASVSQMLEANSSAPNESIRNL